MKIDVAEAFKEPFEEYSKWLSSDIDSISSDMKEAINYNIIADILGDKPQLIRREQTELDHLRAEYGYALLSLLSSYHRIGRAEKMIQYKPRKSSGCSKVDYLELCSISLLNEIYVLEERLKIYLNTCLDIDNKMSGVSKINPGKIMRLYHKTFKNMLAVRGMHTHKQEFECQHIKKIKLIEMLMMSKDFKILGHVLEQSLNDAKRFWLTKTREADAAAKGIVATSFIHTRDLRKSLFSCAS